MSHSCWMRSALGVSMFVVLAAGCGDQSSKTPPASGGAAFKKVEACKLFTQADAAEALGADAVSPDSWRRLDNADERSGVSLSNCMYATGDMRRTAHVVITYYANKTLPGTFEALKAETKSQTAGTSWSGLTSDLLDQSEPVEMEGQVAYWTPDLGTLTVLANGHYVIAITVDPAPDEKPGEGARRAARRVLEKL